MEFSDENILTLFRNGDPVSREKAFRQLLGNYQERLYYHVKRYVNNHEDADDILQNTFIKVWKNIDQFRGDSSLYTWLYRIAGNEAITYINKIRKLNTQELTEAVGNLKTDSNYMEAEVVTKKFEAAVESLPAKQRQVFIMRYYDEMSYEEISKIVETSVGALKASYHHAVKKIELQLSA